ncbi:hypothetical protein GW742_18185 [Citrobacter freundii]|nr:hypothetical protein [Citrobacter freundii]MBC6508284.1 hypothetical protein [Citrobacter freundii]
MPVIKGVIYSPTGAPVAGATLTLTSLHNRAGILKSVLSQVTAYNGQYSFTLVPGIYSVRLTANSRTPSEIGVIRVYDDSPDGTLNDFLGASDIDLRPEALRRFEELAEQAASNAASARNDRERAETAAADAQNAAQSGQDDASRAELAAQASEHAAGDSARYAESARLSAEDADRSRQDAGQSAFSAHNSERAATAALNDSARNALRAESAATDGARSATTAAQSEQAASTSARSAATSEQNAATSASESAQSAEESAESARLAGQHKDSAALSAQAAKDSEDAAAKSAEDAAVTLAGALKTENNLSEIAGAGNEAVAEAHQHLQLGDAAKQNVQSDIYDRTPGIVALPGAFGYGAIFGTTQYFSAASGPAEFLEWVRKTPPGRYNVIQFGNPAGTYNPVITGVNFNGILDIFIPETATAANQGSKGRLIEFRGINGDFYKNRVYTTPAPRLIGWENLRPDDALKKLYGRLTGEWGDPGVNSLILAVYHGGLSGGQEITLTRGKVISGSRLGPLTIKASISATGSYAASPQFITISCNTHPLPGSYVSLSGAPTTKTTDGLVGIFMRIA